MAFVQSDLDKINAAIGSGVGRVKYADGSEIQYRTMDDMLRARQMIVDALTPPANSSRVSLVTM